MRARDSESPCVGMQETHYRHNDELLRRIAELEEHNQQLEAELRSAHSVHVHNVDTGKNEELEVQLPPQQGNKRPRHAGGILHTAADGVAGADAGAASTLKTLVVARASILTVKKERDNARSEEEMAAMMVTDLEAMRREMKQVILDAQAELLGISDFPHLLKRDELIPHYYLHGSWTKQQYVPWVRGSKQAMTLAEGIRWVADQASRKRSSSLLSSSSGSSSSSFAADAECKSQVQSLKQEADGLRQEMDELKDAHARELQIRNVLVSAAQEETALLRNDSETARKQLEATVMVKQECEAELKRCEAELERVKKVLAVRGHNDQVEVPGCNKPASSGNGGTSTTSSGGSGVGAVDPVCSCVFSWGTSVARGSPCCRTAFSDRAVILHISLCCMLPGRRKISLKVLPLVQE